MHHPFVKRAAWPSILVLSAVTSQALAQDATPTETTEDNRTQSSSGDEYVLHVVSSSEDLFGDRRPDPEHPRQVSIISAEVLDLAQVEEIRDLSRVSSNTFSPNTFGVASLPTIRGDLGEIFQNGLRRIGGNNGFGFPTSFNSVQSIDIAKGPPSTRLGPTQRVGGHINLVTKKAHLDRFRGDFSVGAGGFKDDSAFDKQRYRFDVGGPIKTGVLGYRLSAEVVRDDEFHDFAETDSEAVYFTLGYQPEEQTRLDFSVEYFESDFPDIAGFNRPTQELIDKGRIITGTDPSSTSGFPGLDAVVSGGAVISPTGTQKIDRNRVLNDPEDFAYAEHWLVELGLEHQLNDQWHYTNQFLFQDVSKVGIEQNSFVEIIDTNHVFQNRTELAGDFDTDLGGLTLKHQTRIGLDLRYQEVEGFSQFTTEADNPIDLTEPVQTRRIPINDLSIQTPELQALREQLVFLEEFGVFVSPGANYDLDGDSAGDFRLSDTTDSEAFQLGFFFEDDIQFSERWSLLLGLRGDFYDVEAGDAAPPEAVLDAGLTPAEDSRTEFNPSYNTSLRFKPVDNGNLYFTYNYLKATSNSMGGGFTLGADNKLAKENFETESELFELGGKFWFLDESLWVSGALYDQTRSLRNRDGSNSGVEAEGVELEIGYQPSRRFFASFNASASDVRFDNSAAFQGTRAIVDAFDDSRPDIINGTGQGAPGFTVFEPSNRRVPGLPQVMLSGFANYRFDNGFGVNLGAVYTDSYRLDFLNTVRIPDQITVNGGLSLRTDRWEAKLDVLNLTDEENFTPNFNGFFGSTLVFPEEPLNYLLTLTYKL